MPHVQMTYRGVGSSTGQYEFIGADNDPAYTSWSDFGSGDIPLTEAYYHRMKEAGREVAHFPFLIGAMSFFHNIPGLPVSGIGGLNMTGCLLAKIFKTTIKTWDDPEILAINPSLSVPTDQPIYVYHRVKGSSTTNGITTYLHASCPEVWSKDLVGSSITWNETTYEAQGSGNMAAYLASVEYSIGYIDSGHGHSDGLSEVELENADGLFQSSLEAAERGGIALAGTKGLEQGVLPSDPLKSFANVSLHNMPGNVTWPIVAFSYIYFDTNQTKTGATGALLKAFLEYIISDEGQTLVTDYNFVGIPSAVMDVAQKAIDSIVMCDSNNKGLPGCYGMENSTSTWSFETSSSTQKGAGMEPYVISGKRRSWFEYAITSIEGDVEDAGTDITDLQDRVTTLESTDDDEEAEERELQEKIAKSAQAIATAALVFAIAAFFISVAALAKLTSMSSGGGKLTAANLQKLPTRDDDEVSVTSDHHELTSHSVNPSATTGL